MPTCKTVVCYLCTNLFTRSQFLCSRTCSRSCSRVAMLPSLPPSFTQLSSLCFKLTLTRSATTLRISCTRTKSDSTNPVCREPLKVEGFGSCCFVGFFFWGGCSFFGLLIDLLVGGFVGCCFSFFGGAELVSGSFLGRFEIESRWGEEVKRSFWIRSSS